MPEHIEPQTKLQIPLEMIRRERDQGVQVGVVLADAGNRVDSGFSRALAKLGLEFVVGVPGTVSVWRPGEPPKPRGGRGRPPRLLRRSRDHRPVSVRQRAMELAAKAFRSVSWREGTKQRP